MRSACITPITSRDRASAAISGFNVFGSPRRDTTSLPPRLPKSPGRTSISSFALSCCGVAAARGPSKGRKDRSSVGRIRPRWDLALLLFTAGSQDSSLLSCASFPAPAMNSLAPGILGRTAPSPERVSTSTSKTPEHCTAEDSRVDFPRLAPALAHPARETKESFRPRRIAGRESRLESEGHLQSLAECAFAGGTGPWLQSLVRSGQNPVLWC